MLIINTDAGPFVVAGPAFPLDPANAHVMRTGTDYPYREHILIDIAELTRRFGLPEDRQDSVAAWTGDPWGTEWTEEEADQLHRIWEADQLRIAAERS